MSAQRAILRPVGNRIAVTFSHGRASGEVLRSRDSLEVDLGDGVATVIARRIDGALVVRPDVVALEGVPIDTTGVPAPGEDVDAGAGVLTVRA